MLFDCWFVRTLFASLSFVLLIVCRFIGWCLRCFFVLGGLSLVGLF